jgi:hypothetical protein
MGKKDVNMKIDRKKIADALTNKNAIRPCQRCGSNSFQILEGYSNLMLQDDLWKGFVIGGPSVPVALVACKNCGAITQHALGALDLLPQKEEGKQNEK